MGVSTSAIFAKIAIEKGLLDEKKLEKARTLQRLARKDGKNVPLDRACLDLDLLTQAQVKGLERGIRYYVVRKADKIYGNFAVKKKFCDEETVTHCLEKQKTEFTKKKRLVRLSKLLQGLDALTSAQDAEARAYVAKRLTPEESHHEEKAVSEPEARAAVAKRAATKTSGERKASSGDSGKARPAAAKKPTGGARKAYVPSEDKEEEAPRGKGRISKAELKALAASSDESLKLDSPNPLPLEEKPAKAAKSASQDESRAVTSRSKRASVERPAAKLDSAEDVEAKAVVATTSGRARKDVTVSKSAIAAAAAEPAAEVRARPVSASEDALPEVPEAPKPHASADEHPGAGEAATSPAASAPEADVVVAIAGAAKADPAAATDVASAAPAAEDPPGDDSSAQVLAAIEREAPLTPEASGDATSSGGDTKGDGAGAQAGEPVKPGDPDEEMILDLSETAAPGKKRVDFSDSEDL